jgi:hypothetical protein
MRDNHKDELLDVVTFCANNLRCFTSDHINLLANFSGIEFEKSTVSAALSKAKGMGLIKRTNNARISDSSNLASLPRWVWKSLAKKGGKL